MFEPRPRILVQKNITHRFFIYHSYQMVTASISAPGHIFLKSEEFLVRQAVQGTRYVWADKKFMERGRVLWPKWAYHHFRIQGQGSRFRGQG